MLTVVTGGSGSGKSELAENIAVKFTGKKYYIAAMQPFGEEALKRICLLYTSDAADEL